MAYQVVCAVEGSDRVAGEGVDDRAVDDAVGDDGDPLLRPIPDEELTAEIVTRADF